jgi:hypothetical protein
MSAGGMAKVTKESIVKKNQEWEQRFMERKEET